MPWTDRQAKTSKRKRWCEEDPWPLAVCLKMMDPQLIIKMRSHRREGGPSEAFYCWYYLWSRRPSLSPTTIGTLFWRMTHSKSRHFRRPPATIRSMRFTDTGLHFLQLQTGRPVARKRNIRHKIPIRIVKYSADPGNTVLKLHKSL